MHCFITKVSLEFEHVQPFAIFTQVCEDIISNLKSEDIVSEKLIHSSEKPAMCVT